MMSKLEQRAALKVQQLMYDLEEAIQMLIDRSTTPSNRRDLGESKESARKLALEIRYVTKSILYGDE